MDPPPPIASDPFWSQTLVLINGDTDPWYTNAANTGIYLDANVTTSTTSGKFGKGIAFPAIQTLPILRGGMPTMTGDFTAEMWVNNPGLTDTNHYLLSSTTGRHILYILGSSLGIHTLGYVGEVVPIGEWSHIAMVRSANTMSWYVNGMQVATRNDSSAILIDGIGNFVGAGYSTTTYRFTGAMDDIRISTVARYTGNFTPPTAPHPVG